LAKQPVLICREDILLIYSTTPTQINLLSLKRLESATSLEVLKYIWAYIASSVSESSSSGEPERVLRKRKKL